MQFPKCRNVLAEISNLNFSALHHLQDGRTVLGADFVNHLGKEGKVVEE